MLSSLGLRYAGRRRGLRSSPALISQCGVVCRPCVSVVLDLESFQLSLTRYSITRSVAQALHANKQKLCDTPPRSTVVRLVEVAGVVIAVIRVFARVTGRVLETLRRRAARHMFRSFRCHCRVIAQKLLWRCFPTGVPGCCCAHSVFFFFNITFITCCSPLCWSRSVPRMLRTAAATCLDLGLAAEDWVCVMTCACFYCGNSSWRAIGDITTTYVTCSGTGACSLCLTPTPSAPTARG